MTDVNREVYDLVRKHLLGQMQRSVGKVGEKVSCRYRGSDNLRCAVGCLIPDSLYIDNMEGLPVGAPEVWEIVQSVHPGVNPKLLSELQNIHDCLIPTEWEDSLDELEYCAFLADDAWLGEEGIQ